MQSQKPDGFSTIDEVSNVFEFFPAIFLNYYAIHLRCITRLLVLVIPYLNSEKL